MKYSELTKNLFNNTLTPDQQDFVFNVLKTNKTVKIAMKVEEYFRLGHPLDKNENGAYTLAAETLNCHPDTCQRHYNRVYPGRSIWIEKPIKPALIFPMKKA